MTVITRVYWECDYSLCHKNAFVSNVAETPPGWEMWMGEVQPPNALLNPGDTIMYTFCCQEHLDAWLEARSKD